MYTSGSNRTPYSPKCVEGEFPEVQIQKAGCEGPESSLRKENLPDMAPASRLLATPTDGHSQSWMLRSIYFLVLHVCVIARGRRPPDLLRCAGSAQINPTEPLCQAAQSR